MPCCKVSYGEAVGDFSAAGGFDIAVPAYPRFAEFPEAANRTGGKVHGCAFKLTKRGVKILHSGAYSINITASFVNGGSDTQLVLELTHGPLAQALADKDAVVAANTLFSGQDLQFNSFRTVKLHKGDRLRFVISNGVGAPISIVRLEAWQISIQSLP